MKHVVITIGREYGSGGRLIAKQLSEELGITFYDKELITAVARKTGFSENFIRDSEHQRPTNSFLYDLYTAVQTPSVPDQVFIAQAKVIKEAASRESCVIVGRCADYILREHPNCLHVFVHADKAARIKRIVGLGYCDEKKAPDFVTKKDKQRANYYNFYSNNRWDDLQNYDLTIDTSRFSVDLAVDMIIDAAKLLDV